MKKEKIILGLILLVAFWLRFYRLGQVPPSLDWDEASLGYNAYSLLKTGRDEYGQRLPLSIRSFGDYKPPLYAYLTVPSVAIFGLNEFGVRFPSALLGVLTVLATYFLVKELFADLKHPKVKFLSGIPLLTIWLLAISPWHLQFSRVAFEANLGLSLIVFGVLFFLKGLKQPIFWGLSFLIFGLSLFSYHTNRLFVPLLILSLALIYRKEVWLRKKWFFSSTMIFFVFVFPLIFGLSSTLNRARGVSLFSQFQLLTRSVSQIERDEESGFPLGRIVHNRRLVFARAYLKNYFSHFSLKWLFLTGDLARHHAPGMGLLYLFELPLIGWGIFKLLESSGKGKAVVFLWFFLAPIASAFSVGPLPPHAVRSLVFLPTFQIFAALGVVQGITWFRRTDAKGRFLVLAFCGLMPLNLFYFFHQYFVHLNHEDSAFWQYGYKEVVSEVAQRREECPQIFVTSKYGQPYIFFLFYLKYPPQEYQQEIAEVSALDRDRRAFDRFVFLPIEWDKIPLGSLVVGAPDEIPDFANLEKKIYFLNSEEAFRIAVK